MDYRDDSERCVLNALSIVNLAAGQLRMTFASLLRCFNVYRGIALTLRDTLPGGVERLSKHLSRSGS